MPLRVSKLATTTPILRTSSQTACFFSLVIWRQSSYTYVCKGGQWVGWGCVVSRWRNQGGEYGAAYVKAVVGGALKNYWGKRRRRKRRRSKCSDITNVTLSRHLAHEEVTSKQAKPSCAFPSEAFPSPAFKQRRIIK